MRSDVLKELERHLALLNEFQNRPGIDATRLRALMSNLVRLRTELSAVGSTWLQPLRDSEFLAAIKHRSAIPGGTCEFDLPDYFFWLNQPAESRIEAFARWLALLRPLCDAIAEVLWLTRQNGRAREEVAAGGVFNVNFDRDNALPAAAHLPAGGDHAVSGDQRQPLPLQPALPAVARHRAAPDPDRERRALHAGLLPLRRSTRHVPPSLSCPTCGRPIEWSEAFPFRPFCSERCRLIDLGAWLSGGRAIPGNRMSAGRGRADRRRCARRRRRAARGRRVARADAPGKQMDENGWIHAPAPATLAGAWKLRTPRGSRTA